MKAPVRALTVTALNLVNENEAYVQLSLLDSQGEAEDRDRFERLESAMHEIRKKHGNGSIAMGYVQKAPWQE